MYQANLKTFFVKEPGKSALSVVFCNAKIKQGRTCWRSGFKSLGPTRFSLVVHFIDFGWLDFPKAMFDFIVEGLIGIKSLLQSSF